MSNKLQLGQVVGHRKIVSFDGHNKYGQPLWSTECLRCGQVRKNRVSASITRNTKCGKCSRKQTYSIGNILGDKEIIAFDGKNKYGQYTWTVRCVKCANVVNGRSSSSLARKTPCVRCTPNWNRKGYKELYGKWLWTYEYGAIRRGIEWSITPEYLWKLWLDQDGKCWYTGRDLELYTGKSGSTASIDRTDNLKGYVEGNVRWVHTNINRMKSDMELDEFLQLCYDVVTRGIDHPAINILGKI